VLAASALQRLATRFGIAGPVIILDEAGRDSLDLTHHLVRYLESIGVGNRDKNSRNSSTSDVTSVDGKQIELLRRERTVTSQRMDLMAIEDEYRFQMLRALAIPTAFLAACSRTIGR